MTSLELESPVDPVLESLKRVAPGATRFEEAGFVYYFLPSLYLGERANPDRADALLRIGAGDGYASRLLLSVKVRGPTHLNWNGDVFVRERRWHAFSWRVPAAAPGIPMLTGHLRAFR